MKRSKKLNGGFTLIELVVVMAIIAVLAVIIIGAIVVARNTATETTNRANANIIRTGLESYYSRYKVYCGATDGSGSVTITCASTPTFATLATNLTTAGIPTTVNNPTVNVGGGNAAFNADAQHATLTPVNYNNTGNLPAISLP